MAKTPTIMVIRHAEKPAGAISGVKESGESSARDLTVRGWQRAGALTALLAPAHRPLQHNLLVTPRFIFASAAVDDPAGGNARSRRSQQTVMPLAERLNVSINLNFSKGGEKAVAKAALACDGPVLIAWQHEYIVHIVNYILGTPGLAPDWPSDRFDIVLVLTSNPATGNYTLAQVPQSLLAGDSERPL